MAQETNQSQAPLLCTTGCGFYGNPRNNGMCSVCYKDFLQRQNSNGRVSPPASSSAVSSLGESLLTQCSESSTVDVPSAIPHTDTATGQTSVVSSQTLLTPAPILSAEESPAEAKDGLKTEDLQGISSTATTVGSGSTASSEAGVARESRQPGKRPSQEDVLEDGSPKSKRRLEDTEELLDGEKASVSPEGAVEGQDKPSDKPKAKKSRCFTCRKKVGLTGFDCRCGNVFCGMHRYSDIHNCPFDYKADAAEKIRKENPVIVGEKIQKI